MKRNRPDAAAIERMRRAAEQDRVEAGLPAVDPGDVLYEQLQAELRATRKRRKERR